MRDALAQLYGQRLHFTATFERIGKKRAYRGWGNMGDGYDGTVLLKDIKDDTGRIVADHLWFSLTEGFRYAGLNEGDTVRFDARVDDYLKGYEKDAYDYKLSRPTRIFREEPGGVK